ncbi:hypothetical protein DI383_08345 [Flavobacteriaceae bacterium LYZ1037]|nr:hypothetical protein DI383_08345 [Flavobacteriaceae bacterium LYZ1037]
MSNKSLFINYVSVMNTKPLVNVLVKNAFNSYNNISFIEKLNNIFSKLIASGNTSLKVHKGIGVCTCNKDEKVLCFVGNKTNDYFTFSYQEDDNNYYNFSTSCSEVLYNNPPLLSKFYFFTIKPKETTEYKNYKEIFNPIHDFKIFSSECVCSVEVIELWLEKYKNLYNDTLQLLGEKGGALKLDSVGLLVNREFEVLYGKLDVLSRLYKKEDYFKQQLDDYNDVKDSVSKLKNWFTYQAENKNEYQLFSSVFYDNRELSHYRLELDELALNPEDFKYTLKFMEIIEDAQAIEFKGTIKLINDLEVFEKTKTRRASSRRIMVLTIDDFYCSEYQISFSDGRVKHLDNLNEGQYVKVLARLTGGEWKNPEGIKEYKYNLYGWRVEKLSDKLKIKTNDEDMDLYSKYILPMPF